MASKKNKSSSKKKSNAAKTSSQKKPTTKTADKNVSPSTAAKSRNVRNSGSSASKKVSSALASHRNDASYKTKNLPSVRKIFLICILTFVAVLILMLLWHQLYLHFFMHLKTITAVEITIADTIETTGWTVRNETVITTDKTGVIVPEIDNGGRVSKGQAVALVFPNAQAANAYARAEEIDEAIEKFESMITAKEDVIFENSVEGRLDNTLISLVRAISADDMDDVDELNEDLLYLLNKRQIATHTVENFDSNIEALKAERSELSNAYPDTPGRITSSLPGYYISMVDGYEDVLKADGLGEMTPEAFDAALASYTGEVPASAVGKITSDYSWNIACKITVKEAESLSIGKKYELELPYSEVDSVSAKLTALNSGSGNEVLAVFEIDVTIPELLEIRNQPVTIVLMKATGLGVPTDALRVDRYNVSDTDAQGNLTGFDREVSEVGVYIMYGRSVRFRRVEIIHTVDEMVVVEVNNGSGWLKRYDEIIIGGKGLYDGKIVQY